MVLSACQTGVGEAVSGEGIYGLKRAFAIAGAASQLVSLWKVDDAATAALMGQFYRHLATGLSRAEALQSVQRQLLAGTLLPSEQSGARRTVGRANQQHTAPDWRHPFYWASFTLSGADGPVAFKPKSQPAN